MDYTAKGTLGRSRGAHGGAGRAGHGLSDGTHGRAGLRLLQARRSGDVPREGRAPTRCASSSCRDSARCARASTSRAPAASRASSAAPMRCRCSHAALARAREGNAQVVGIVGQRGRRQEPAVLRVPRALPRGGAPSVPGSTGVAHGKNLPLLPILQVFREYYGITEQDSGPTVREKIAGRMLLFDEGYREVLPIVFDFFGVPDPENPAPTHGPGGAPAPAVRRPAAPLPARHHARAPSCSCSRICTGSTAAARR